MKKQDPKHSTDNIKVPEKMRLPEISENKEQPAQKSGASQAANSFTQQNEKNEFLDSIVSNSLSETTTTDGLTFHSANSNTKTKHKLNSYEQQIENEK